MKRPPRPGLKPAALLPLWLGLQAMGALVPTEWQHRQALNVPAPGVVRVDLTAASFDSAAPSQEDLRILDPNGREIAFLLDQPPAVSARTIPPASFETRIDDGASRLLIATGTREPLEAVTLATPHPFFLRAAQIETSDDNENWTTLDRGVPLFRQWGAEKLEIPLGRRSAGYLRITVTDNQHPALPFTGASLSVAAGPVPAPIPVNARIARRDEFAGETVLTVALDGRNLPLAGLEFATSDALFMRRVTISVREVREAVPTERPVASGTIYRVALDGASSRAALKLPLACTPATRELLVHLHNGDSPPLAIDRITATRRPVNLLFRAPSAGSYLLLSGNPQAGEPHYDLATFAGDLREATASQLVPGELEDTPDYHSRDSLAVAPLPDVPLTGAPLDASNWPDRRAIGISTGGVQELELDLEVLARTRSDFADLRVLRGGNQIPYVLEQPALARSLTLTPVAAADPKRPAVSLWQIHLPQSGLPLRQVVLTSNTSLFQREFRIFEKLRAQDGRSYDNAVASGTWRRTPEPGIPENRVFDLQGRLETDTLWLETDNGDNPAIALGSVRFVYPVVRLIFKVGETDGLTLAYGNREAGVPRYDLSLVAVKLLTSSRNAAQLGAGAPASAPPKNPLGAISGGYILWAALALVVVVLLAVVAKLLPKPPAA